MNTSKLNDIINANVCGYDIHDYKDYTGLYLESANWKSTGNALTNEELDDINDNNNDWLMDQIDIGSIIDDLKMSYGME